MLNRVSCIISSFFLRQSIISENEFAAYVYSVEILLSTAINSALFLIISLRSNKPVESICFLIAFAVLRKNCGGVHAANHVLCGFFMAMLLGLFLFCIEIIPQNIQQNLSKDLVLVSLLGVWLGAPAQTPNKPLNNKEQAVFKKRSRLVIICFCIVVLIGNSINELQSFLCSCAMGCFAAMCFMWLAKLKNRTVMKEDQ